MDVFCTLLTASSTCIKKIRLAQCSEGYLLLRVNMEITGKFPHIHIHKNAHSMKYKRKQIKHITKEITKEVIKENNFV